MIAHVPTMFMMLIAASGTLAFSVGLVARARDKDGLQLWTAALVLQTLVFCLFSLRDKIPDLFSIIIANAILSASYSTLLLAIARFQQRQLSWWLLWLPPVVLAVVLSLLQSNIGARIVVAGFVFTVQYLIILYFLLERKYRVSGRGKYLLVVGLGIMISVMSIRTLSVIFSLDSISSMLSSTPIQVLTFAMAFVTLILISNGFVLMTKERADERIRLLAMTDRLTGAWNRIWLEEAAMLEIARLERYGHPVSLIMVDLDHFKQINDRFGHAAGDLVLKTFCTIARGGIRTTDILGRWGGEEFLILLPDSDLASAVRLAERIRSAIDQHHFADGLHVTASLGLAVCQPGDTWGSWLERADKAMYRAKAMGRNRVETESPY